MARIRSIHPSLFTDEAWVSCSPLARLLYIGLMTEADDQGLFEWKPLQIRMRLLAGDAADVPALLDELVAANLIAPLESAGKKLGAIRYFRRFQRPKKPNSTFVLPAEWVKYVGLTTGDGEPDADEQPPVENQFPTKGEKSPQMEEGGGRSSSVPDGTGASPPADDLAELRALPIETGAWRLGVKVMVELGGKSDGSGRSLLGKFKAEGLLPDEMWRIGEAAWKAKTPDPTSYLTAASNRIIAERSQASITAPSEARQIGWMEDLKLGLEWKVHERGPKPGEAGCRVRPDIQRRFGIEPAGVAA